MITIMLYLFAFLSMMLSGAIFGFFYAWVCSTMWGLDAADPAVAIQAMQAMNASVRNAVFAPAFFGTPVVLLVTAALAYASRLRKAAMAFAAAGLIYLLGGLILTMTVNVPVNEALAAISAPESTAEAQRIWEDYSRPWQIWNTVRTCFSGVTLALTGFAIFALNERLRST
ncbi:membrane protein [Mesorhizobium tianshanense]|uniref:Putative membrane protein n=1 Tax=Mesorhizobium tianshanense TaxID=39844 RepID=A0A562NBI4_9HYPH|nr:anthrone oxygenase family protein [Mesorhizobium tianshanense]TWI29484.1 putative membrane protein [Mesorhizobium tianshanense]GLS34869.1 membrane protein [Mesorhizobium tianshanense]